mgnify:CR=1 FL=1
MIKLLAVAALVLLVTGCGTPDPNDKKQRITGAFYAVVLSEETAKCYVTALNGAGLYLSSTLDLIKEVPCPPELSK